MRRLAVAGIAAAWASVPLALPPATVPPAAGTVVAGTVVAGTVVATGAEEHRAAVIVDTGTQVKSVCVRFREESISGVEALARAQVDPVLQAFSGKGAAVCALCGVGCPAGDSCLSCNPDGKFWSYSRAPAGTGSLRTSGVGASSTTVHDGDVEGWKWALGGAPPFQTVEQVCGEAPASTTTTPAPTSPAVSTTRPGTAAIAPAPAGAPTTTGAPTRPATTAASPMAAPASGSPGAATDAAATSSLPPDDATPATVAGDRAPSLAASRRAQDPDGGGSGPELALFAAVLAGLVAWGARTRRARARQRH